MSEPPTPRIVRVLLVDDSEGDLLMVKHMLSRVRDVEFRLDWSPSYAGAIDAFRSLGAHDIYLLDYQLKPGNGLDLQSDLAKLGCRSPIIILTGYSDPTVDHQAIRSGAADYLVKSEITPALLERALRHALERARMTQALRDSEQRYRTLAANFPNGCVLLVDERGTVTMVDGSGVAACGIDATIVGKAIGEAFPNDFGTLLRERQLRGALPVTFEAAIGDRHCLVSMTSFSVTTASRDVLVVIQDLSELRHAQLALIANERMAAIGALASGVAHEFNNLHTIIMGFAEQALRHPDLETALRRKLEVLHTTAARAARVTENLLTFARGRDSGFTVASLPQIVEETVEIVRDEFESVGVIFALRLGDIAPIRAQPAGLGQVVMNLLINACHAMAGRNQRRLSISCFQDGPRAAIRVGDTGEGIPSDNLNRIFMPFFSTKSALPAGSEGRRSSGLGLSVCRTIVEAHGGEITVESVLGEGSTFTVWLPIEEGLVLNPSSRVRPGIRLREHTGARMLVVEDEAHLRALFRGEFEEAGWEVLTAVDGQEAIELLATEPVDVVLVDMQMPRLSGEEFIRRLRIGGKSEGPRLIAMSGNPLDHEIGDLVDAALQKPFDLDQINATVAAVLASRPRVGDHD